MKEKTILNQIRVWLGMEVKLEQMKLSDGETILETDSFETGAFADNQAPDVFIITPDEQKVPLPIGEYELEDGRMLVVKVEGKIAEIKEVPMEEEQPSTEQGTTEMPVEASSNPAPAKEPKSVIETTTREVRFSDEEFEALKKENAELKALLTEISEHPKVTELAEEVKPIVHNPENKTVVNLEDLDPLERFRVIKKRMNG